MNVKVISRNVGYALLVSALFMFFSVLVSIWNGNDSALAALSISCVITFITGAFPFIFVRKSETITLQDGYMIIVLSWMLSFIFGMLPYLMWGGIYRCKCLVWKCFRVYNNRRNHSWWCRTTPKKSAFLAIFDSLHRRFGNRCIPFIDHPVFQSGQIAID